MDKIEFIAPYPLEECVQRLESYNESLRHHDEEYQVRTAIKVKAVDAQTYKFSLKRVQRGDFFWSFNESDAYIDGTLSSQTDKTTLVKGAVDINWIAVMLPPGIVFLLSPACFTVNWGLAGLNVLLSIVLSALAIVLVTYVAWRGESEQKKIAIQRLEIALKTPPNPPTET